tara:strand:+ start:1911 stop:3089 length:1179 start_codon:yes stop_codon:yes gene_type:complete
MSKITSIDLFSGCGGLSLGLKWAGIDTVLANDIDFNCQKTYELNFPESQFLLGDLSEFQKKDFDKHITSRPDLVVGGPPCQGFSLANKNRNKIKDDPRNKLFYQFLKVINWYSPKVFLMENVKGLLSMKQGKVIETILEEFKNAGKYGYDIDFEVLKASDYGVPQGRERVIVMGFSKDLDLFPEFPRTVNSKMVTVNEAISDLPVIHAGEGKDKQEYDLEPKSEYQAFMREKSDYIYNHIAMRHTKRLIDRFTAIQPGQNLVDVWETHGAVKRGDPKKKSSIKFSQNNFRVYGNKPAPTIAASFQSNFVHPQLHRNFTAREGARLQSFPDNFIFEGMRTKMSWEKGLSQYQQIGNAVPPLLAKAIGEKILDILSNGNSKNATKRPEQLSLSL